MCVRGTAGFLATGCHALGVLRWFPVPHGAEVPAFCSLLAPPPPACPLELCLGAQQQMGLVSALALKGPDVEICQNKLEALWPERQ